MGGHICFCSPRCFFLLDSFLGLFWNRVLESMPAARMRDSGLLAIRCPSCGQRVFACEPVIQDCFSLTLSGEARTAGGGYQQKQQGMLYAIFENVNIGYKRRKNCFLINDTIKAF